jgi:hypothetical protein
MHFLVTNEARRLLRLVSNNEVSNDLDMRHMTRRYHNIINNIINNNSIPTIVVMIITATIKVNNNNNNINSINNTNRLSNNSITTILHLSISPMINILLNLHRRIILLLIISTTISVVVVLRLQISHTTNTNNSRHRNNTNHHHHINNINNNTLVVINNSIRLVTMRRRAMMMVATISDAALLRVNHLRPFMTIDARLRQLATTNIRHSSSSSSSSPAATTMIAVMRHRRIMRRHPMTAMRRPTNNISSSSSSTRRHNNNTISKTVTHHHQQPTTMLRLHLTVILTKRGLRRVTTISTTLDLASTHSRRLSNSHTIKADHSSCHRNNCRLSSSSRIVTINRWRHRVRHATTSHITRLRQQMFVANLFRVISAVRLRRLVLWQRRVALLSLCAMTTVRQRSPSDSESATKMQRRPSRRMPPTRATTVRTLPRKVVRTTMTASVRKARTMSTVKRASLWRTTSARRHARDESAPSGTNPPQQAHVPEDGETTNSAPRTPHTDFHVSPHTIFDEA